MGGTETQTGASVAERLMATQPTGLFIDGAFVDARSGSVLPVEDPATGNRLCEVAQAGEDDIDRAVAAARTAFDAGPWPTMDGTKRARILHRLAELIDDHGEELALLETLDNGMPLTTSRGEVKDVVDHFDYFAGWCTKLAGDTIGTVRPETHLVFTLREPLGVIGAVIAWNFPLNNAAWKLGAILAAGNCVVLKPAEQTPLSALRLAELSLEAGVPPGVLNVVPGFGPTAGAPLVVHAGIDKVAFTGETSTGRIVAEAAGANLKPVTLELGGKSPSVVFGDVTDVDAVARGVLQGSFHQEGQVCSAGSRVFVERSFYDEFRDKLASSASKLRQGSGLNPETTLGPLISKEQTERVRQYLEAGRQEGAEYVVGGGGLPPELEGGNFVPPTIFSNLSDHSLVAREEIFGPVAVLLPFDSVDEVIARANSTPYGLAAGVWTSNLANAFDVVRRVRSGTVWVNSYNLFDAGVPFGGVKQSGYGRELGRAGLETMTQLKTVWVGWRR